MTITTTSSVAKSENNGDTVPSSAHEGCSLDKDEKSLTFRKRRLSLTLQKNNCFPIEDKISNQQHEDNCDDELNSGEQFHSSNSSNVNTNGNCIADHKCKDIDEKAQTFRKRSFG
jgi:hypothetical protein